MKLSPTIIIYSTEEVFSSSVLLNITPGRPYYRTAAAEKNSITGVIHFSGSATGYAAINMSNETATLVTEDFLFGEDLEVTDLVTSDAICEMANILAGRIKAYIDPPGSNLHISLPELCRGNECLPAPVPDAKKITIPFHLDEGEFLVEVQLAE